MNAISYSLFGFGKERQANCFDFNSYARGLMINIRMNRLIYPGWENILHIDEETYNEFGSFFESINGLYLSVSAIEPLCRAMLWRMKPIFEFQTDTKIWKYEHVICRDLDSPTTYREAQAVQHWIHHDKAMHAITDSISHNLPLMGGMIGAKPAYFTERVSQSWQEMLGQATDINWSVKGADQMFLNKYIYPKFADKGTESITQHYIKGHGDTFLNDFHSTIPDIEPFGIDRELKESNEVCGHIGAAGFYQGPMFKFLQKHEMQFRDILELEKKHSAIFNWCLDNTFK